jgi:hypothetical protein
MREPFQVRTVKVKIAATADVNQVASGVTEGPPALQPGEGPLDRRPQSGVDSVEPLVFVRELVA